MVVTHLASLFTMNTFTSAKITNNHMVLQQWICKWQCS